MLTVKASTSKNALRIKDVGHYDFENDLFTPSSQVKEMSLAGFGAWEAIEAKPISNPVLIRVELSGRQWMQSIKVTRDAAGIVTKVTWSKDAPGSAHDYFDIHFENGKPDRGDDSVGSDCLNRLSL